MKTFKSAISGVEFPIADKILGKTVGKSIFDLIKNDHPKFKYTDVISIDELQSYRDSYLSNILLKDIRQLTKSEQAVMDSLHKGTTITDKVEDDDDGKN
ncbi:MAG: hypothetical protein ABI426_07665, partial [Flavobacterium sp.]